MTQHIRFCNLVHVQPHEGSDESGHPCSLLSLHCFDIQSIVTVADVISDQKFHIFILHNLNVMLHVVY